MLVLARHNLELIFNTVSGVRQRFDELKPASTATPKGKGADQGSTILAKGDFA